MNCNESLDFLFSQLPMFSRIGAAAYKPGLETSLRLDDYFGNPHRKFKSIHVAGTNGKGSTSHSIASVLQAAGYKTGLYTSPHLADFRERMRINGRMIPEKKVVDFVERWQKCGYDGHPSFFELTMMMAFDWFASENVDYAVIEVGMGGRLDSTNIISPIAAIITNISFDHTQFLGTTLPAIASEKAGIIKGGLPVVIGHAEDDVREVFEKKGAEVGADVVFAEDAPLLAVATPTDEFTFRCSSPLTEDFTFPMAGEYQRENINTVLHGIAALRRAGVAISSEAIKQGLENVVESTGFAGRWMIASRDPLTICDTGHNEAGLSYTMPQLESLLKKHREVEPSARLRIVIGFVNDKDVAHIVNLFPRDAQYYVTQASVPRAMDSAEVLAYLNGEALDCRVIEGGVAEAYAAAKSDARSAEGSPEDIIFVGGSTFVVADFLASRGKNDSPD